MAKFKYLLVFIRPMFSGTNDADRFGEELKKSLPFVYLSQIQKPECSELVAKWYDPNSVPLIL